MLRKTALIVAALSCLLSAILAACAPAARDLVLDNPPSEDNEQPLEGAARSPASRAQPLPSPSSPSPTDAGTSQVPTPPPTALDPGSGVLVNLWKGNPERTEIHLVDPATGQNIPGYPPLQASSIARSVKGEWLAGIETSGQICESYSGGLACRSKAQRLHFLETSAWRTHSVDLPKTGWVSNAAFSPDASHLAVVHQDKDSVDLMLFLTATGEMLGQHEISIRPSLLEFSQDGAALLVYGQPAAAQPGMSKPEPARALLVDVTSLAIVWDQQLQDLISGDWCLEGCQGKHGEQSFAYWKPATVISADRSKLYIIHADQDKLTTVDFKNRAVNSLELLEPQSWFEKLLALTAGVARAKGGQNGTIKEAVLSPDGLRLFVVGRSITSQRDKQGNWQVSEDFLGLKVIAVETGRILDSRQSEATTITIFPDGSYLFLNYWRSGQTGTEVLDANSLEPVKNIVGWQISTNQRIDGRPILVAVRYGAVDQAAVFDLNTLELGQSWPLRGYWILSN